MSFAIIVVAFPAFELCSSWVSVPSFPIGFALSAFIYFTLILSIARIRPSNDVYNLSIIIFMNEEIRAIDSQWDLHW